MKNIKWKISVALPVLLCVISSVQGYDRSLVAGNDYIDAINSEAQSIQRNSMKVKVDEHSVHDGSKQRLNVEDMLEKLKRLTTHGGQ